MTSVNPHSAPGCCQRFIHACGIQEHHVNPKDNLWGETGKGKSDLQNWLSFGSKFPFGSRGAPAEQPFPGLIAQ